MGLSLGSTWVNARFGPVLWAGGGLLLALVAILVVAWIMGDAKPTRWIETPVAAPAKAGA
jgi:hypothetical protein